MFVFNFVFLYFFSFSFRPSSCQCTISEAECADAEGSPLGGPVAHVVRSLAGKVPGMAAVRVRQTKFQLSATQPRINWISVESPKL